MTREKMGLSALPLLLVLLMIASILSPLAGFALLNDKSSEPQSTSHSGNWTLLGGGDHAGHNWTISTNTTVAGHHYNISSFQVTSSTVVRVNPFNGTSFGNFSLNATTIQVAGIINATGSGYSGGAGGAGNIGGGSGGSGGSGPGAGSSGTQGGVEGTSDVGRGGGGGGGSSAYFTGGDGGASTGGSWGVSGTAPLAIYSRFAPVQAMGSGGGGGGGGGGRNNQYSGTQGDPGGSGGGSIDFNADVITISGLISTDGESGGSGGAGGVNPWGDTGHVGLAGGGAAAGTQFFSSRIFNLTGNLSAQGGSGANAGWVTGTTIYHAGAGSDSAISVEDVSTIEFDSQATLRGIVIWPGGGSWLPLEGGDHGGQPWIISSNSTAAGYHYNISNFVIQQNVILSIKAYNGSDYGNLTIRGESANIHGIIDGNQSGWLGGAGGVGYGVYGQNGGEGGSGSGSGETGEDRSGIGKNGGSSGGGGGGAAGMSSDGESGGDAALGASQWATLQKGGAGGSQISPDDWYYAKMGSGGGGGGSGGSEGCCPSYSGINGTFGGAGGAAITLFIQDNTSISGSINLVGGPGGNGGAGGTSNGGGGGGGGGAAGGSLYIQTRFLGIQGTVDTSGGDGGASAGMSSEGGSGSSGYIIITSTGGPHYIDDATFIGVLLRRLPMLDSSNPIEGIAYGSTWVNLTGENFDELANWRKPITVSNPSDEPWINRTIEIESPLIDETGLQIYEPFSTNTSSLTDGLLAYWSLEESAPSYTSELGGSSYSFPLATSNPTRVSGVLSNAQDFDSGDEIYNAALDSALSGKENVTISAWVNMDSLGASGGILSNH